MEALKTNVGEFYFGVAFNSLAEHMRERFENSVLDQFEFKLKEKNYGDGATHRSIMISYDRPDFPNYVFLCLAFGVNEFPTLLLRTDDKKDVYEISSMWTPAVSTKVVEEQIRKNIDLWVDFNDKLYREVLEHAKQRRS